MRAYMLLIQKTFVYSCAFGVIIDKEQLNCMHKILVHAKQFT